MIMKFTGVCAVVLAMLGSFCHAQYGKKTTPPQTPQQQFQTFEKKIEWSYPGDPQIAPKPTGPFEQRFPVAAATVAVECRESIAHVEVKKDMFGIGQPINPNDLTLGNCAPVSEDNAAQVLIYESELHQCGSQLALTNDALVYTFILNYNPRAVGASPVIRTSQAAVIVECHYPRRHNVSSLPLDPLWVPFSAVKMAEEFLYFSMTLVTDDFMFERPVFQYFLGDLIRVEVAVMQYFHVPLRVYVDRCVATLSPDATSTPSYAFINNFGCFVDARITGSDSKFLARTEENKLRFQLEAFRFQNSESGVIYITCQLRATSTSTSIDSQNRACSYSGRWTEASGVDAACGSCDSSDVVPYAAPAVEFGNPVVLPGGNTGGGGQPGFPKIPFQRPRKSRDVTNSEVFQYEGTVRIGPIPVMEKKI
ncbi:zona pellucida sperm-binding protein 3-like [Cyprinodon tularosa]|uniref:zona pellucida sperm-binding protein 3-like n=1 Tax=Cyprinodon tularosa TaxID=77115 RepID=UPI0018E1E639|nr:zona pellucida sperm-binding protein 3-like [Cyprinodon tularosa]